MIPESIDDLSVIATNNVPQGGDNVGGTLDDILRAIQAIMKRDLALKKAETAEGTSFTPGDDLNSTTVQEAIEEVSDLVKDVGLALAIGQPEAVSRLWLKHHAQVVLAQVFLVAAIYQITEPFLLPQHIALAHLNRCPRKI